MNETVFDELLVSEFKILNVANKLVFPRDNVFYFVDPQNAHRWVDDMHNDLALSFNTVQQAWNLMTKNTQVKGILTFDSSDSGDHTYGLPLTKADIGRLMGVFDDPWIASRERQVETYKNVTNLMNHLNSSGEDAPNS